MTHNQRLFTALTLSLLILVSWQYFFITPTIQKQPYTADSSTTKNKLDNISTENIVKILPREDIIKNGYLKKQRVSIESETIIGSLNLSGSRIDDIVLKQYNQLASKTSPCVTLLAPSNTKEVFFLEFGWIDSTKQNIDLPKSDTIWQTKNNILSPQDAVTMLWQNAQGIEFIIKFTMDERYMLNVQQSIINHGNNTILLRPYFIINRSFAKNQNSNMLIHEGAIGVLNNKLYEMTFEDIKDDKEITHQSQKGWVGMVDKYWLTAIVPEKNQPFNFKISSFKVGEADRFQIDGLAENQVIKPGEHVESKYNIFVGPKQLKLLEQYEAMYNIDLFDRAVDFGILYFITKPIFILLSYLYQIIGNFGYAIILLTVLIKILLFPLSYKSFVSMNKLKALQPQMFKIKERYADDMQRMQKAMIELYKKEKANPMSGCLPIIIQMPIFFALYKVLYVTIEMRHAPFALWINDLSAPDPTTIFNLFGLISWSPPGFLMIGVLPIIMALTMHIQQRLNPEPSDPVQAKVMKILPLIFLFMFSSFPSGLVLYWAWSNALSILQQILIKKLHQ